jgi:hypothetical protein
VEEWKSRRVEESKSRRVEEWSDEAGLKEEDGIQINNQNWLGDQFKLRRCTLHINLQSLFSLSSLSRGKLGGSGVVTVVTVVTDRPQELRLGRR